MKVLVDNVAVQAIEACLMTHLQDIISPASVMQMKDETISRIAAESEDSQELRGRSFLFPLFQNRTSSIAQYLHKRQAKVSTILENKLADSTATTEQLNRKATVLKAGLEICKRYTGRRSTTSLSLAAIPTPAPRRRVENVKVEKERVTIEDIRVK